MTNEEILALQALAECRVVSPWPSQQDRVVNGRFVAVPNEMLAALCAEALRARAIEAREARNGIPAS